MYYERLSALFSVAEILGTIHKTLEVDLINLDVFAYLERRCSIRGSA